jgi:hypothetical protein
LCTFGPRILLWVESYIHVYRNTVVEPKLFLSAPAPVYIKFRLRYEIPLSESEMEPERKPHGGSGQKFQLLATPAPQHF